MGRSLRGIIFGLIGRRQDGPTKVVRGVLRISKRTCVKDRSSKHFRLNCERTEMLCVVESTFEQLQKNLHLVHYRTRR